MHGLKQNPYDSWWPQLLVFLWSSLEGCEDVTVPCSWMESGMELLTVWISPSLFWRGKSAEEADKCSLKLLLNLRSAACQPTGLSNVSRDASITHTLVLLSVWVCHNNFRKILLMFWLSLSTVVLTPILSHLLLPNLISIADFFQRLVEKLRRNCTHRGCGGKTASY